MITTHPDANLPMVEAAGATLALLQNGRVRINFINVNPTYIKGQIIILMLPNAGNISNFSERNVITGFTNRP